ncbi:hypothetical protein TSUD_412490 [Trifolium subterraneum]|uniref:Bystin n=1 Tax=Trifolium subterraneum TaxID=3900 RepID=A0A2Z6PU11_TRISU|nr:hypothetical protein TSUD_412490 [Trifolium subterraneum]
MSGTTGERKRDDHDTGSDGDAEAHPPPKKSLKKDSDEDNFDDIVMTEDRNTAKQQQQKYQGVATFLSKYTVGNKFPDAFEHICSMQNWEEDLFITKPENWSPSAVYQATRIFVHNFGATKSQHFFRIVLLPRVRKDIYENNHLNIALYRSLQKALQKPSAFCKGILIPLCESRTCTPREECIVGSIIEKKAFPLLYLWYVNLFF